MRRFAPGPAIVGAHSKNDTSLSPVGKVKRSKMLEKNEVGIQ